VLPFGGQSRPLRVSDLAASSRRGGYTIVEEQIEIRAENSDNAFHFGTFTKGVGFCEFANGACWWRGVGATRPRGIEVSASTVAWGPFHDGSDDVNGDVILVKGYTPGARKVTIVRAPRAGDFKLAGRFLAYREIGSRGFGSTGSIVLVDWPSGTVVRRLDQRNAFAFDVDERGRVAIAREADGGSEFGVYNTRGRFTRFSRDSLSDEAGGEIWVSGGRVALARTRADSRRVWDVTTLSGRSVASMRAPNDALLTDFDGSCLAYQRKDSAVYVAAVRRVPKRSICR
jgi:hypothetical protein